MLPATNQPLPIRPLALDLFCGAGGASLGLHSAGFAVHGVDIELCRRDGSLKNPVILRGLEFAVENLTAADLQGYDFVWASPPCQAFSAARRLHGAAPQPAPADISVTRDLIQASGIPAVIENVPSAPIRADLVLTGPAVGEPGMLRKRHFEFLNLPPAVAADLATKAAAAAEHHPRDPDIVSLSGNSAPRARRVRRGYRKFERLNRAAQLAWKQRVIGAPWMTWHECNQAVPARYAHLIGAAVLEHFRATRRAKK